MAYIHFDIVTSQVSKYPGKPSGDVIYYQYNPTNVVLVIADGIGSGIKANIAAQSSVSRIKTLLQSGFTLREAFERLVNTMEDAKEKDLPYTAFSLVRILQDGIGTCLTYEAPTPLFVTKAYSTILKSRSYSINKAIVSETIFELMKNEGIVLVTDGITQAGLNQDYSNGLQLKGLNHFVDEQIKSRLKFKHIPKEITENSFFINNKKMYDDLSAVIIFARKGRVVNIFTGPPKKEEMDSQVVKKFLGLDGLKIVCGASTAKIVARETSKELKIDEKFASSISPPNYKIEGIDLVTEGIITLNQLYNIWDEDESKLEKFNPVTDLVTLLKVADRINIVVGKADNPANEDISYSQMGLLKRRKIIPLLINKFNEDGKVVVVEEV